MRRRRISLFAACFMLLFIAGITVAAAKSIKQKLDINQVAGVYKRPHQIYIHLSDDFSRVEDVLEIVKHSKSAAYFKTRLYFENGHSCGIFGVAEVEGNALVYREPIDIPSENGSLLFRPKVTAKNQCVLEMKFSGDAVSFKDKAGNCRQKTCGVRGGYEWRREPAFKASQRRKIRYMSRILDSRDYRYSVEDFEEAQKSRRFP